MQEINYLTNASSTLIPPYTSPSAPLQEINYLTNASSTLIPPPTSPSAPLQEINYLTNARITLIPPPTSPSASLQEINYLTNARITLIPPPTSPSAPLQEIDYLTNASTTLIPPPTSPSAPLQEIDYLTMPQEYKLMRPSKLAKERPNRNIAASNPNSVFNNLEMLSNSTQNIKQNSGQYNQVPIKLFYRNQMTSNYKIEEKQLQQIIHNNIKSVFPDVHVKLLIYYKNKKLNSLLSQTIILNTKNTT